MFQLPGVGHSYKECTSPHLHAANWGSCHGRRSGQRKNRNGHNSHSGASNSRHHVTLIYNNFLDFFFVLNFCYHQFLFVTLNLCFI